MNKPLILLGIFMALLFKANTIIAQNEGDAAPDFSFSSTTGSTLSLSDYEGKVLYIFLFGHSCPFCLAVGNDTEEKIHKQYKSNEDFRIIGLDTWDGSQSAVTNFREQTMITYPLGLKAGKMENLYSTSYDRIIIIDRDGKIAYKGNTSVANDLDNSIEALDNLLQQNPTSVSHQTDEPKIGEFYPNPASEQVNIQVSNLDELSVSIYNPIGKMVWQQTYSSLSPGESLTIDVKDLPQGYYYVRFNHAGREVVKRFLISRN